MRFPLVFRRAKGGTPASDKILGSDAAPTTTPPSASSDNVLFSRPRDTNGWPCQRIAVVWTTTAGTPTALNFDAYFWEESTAHWHKINASSLSLNANTLGFFDIVTILDPPATKSSLDAPGSGSNAGSIEVMIVASDPGAQVNGEFVIAAGPDTTTVGT